MHQKEHWHIDIYIKKNIIHIISLRAQKNGWFGKISKLESLLKSDTITYTEWGRYIWMDLQVRIVCKGIERYFYIVCLNAEWWLW